MPHPLEYDRHAMALAGIADDRLIDPFGPLATQHEQLIRAYLWVKANTAYDEQTGSTSYPSVAGMTEHWDDIISGD